MQKLRLFLLIVAAGLSCLLVACGTTPAEIGSEPGKHEVEQDKPEIDHNEDSDDHTASRVPNNDAVIRIVAPPDGALLQAGNDILVQIETENFNLGQNGNHWHLYVDDVSHGMITGADFNEVVSGLETGQHTISAYLSISTHGEMEEGTTITVSVVQ